MKKRLKSVFLIVLLVLNVLNFSAISYAEENDGGIENFICYIKQNYIEFKDVEIGNNKRELIDENGDSKHFTIYNLINEENDGYIIWNNYDDIVVEFSMNKNPYLYAENNNSLNNSQWCYKYGNYFLLKDDIEYEFDSQGFIYNILETKNYISTCSSKIYDDYKPQLQNGNNCIVAAIANLIDYYGDYHFPWLNDNLSFADIKSIVNSYFKYGSSYKYENNSVPKVINRYVKSRNNLYSAYCEVIWSPNISKLKYEINEGRPCLVGFAKGSSYSSSVGHMTACFGYQEIPGSGGNIMLKLADGHQKNYVYKTWSSYNDCVITAQIFK